jgi:hypothetical protein
MTISEGRQRPIVVRCPLHPIDWTRESNALPAGERPQGLGFARRSLEGSNAGSTPSAIRPDLLGTAKLAAGSNGHATATVVEAGAGYGKSVLGAELVADWCAVGVEVQLDHPGPTPTSWLAGCGPQYYRRGFLMPPPRWPPARTPPVRTPPVFQRGTWTSTAIIPSDCCSRLSL